MFGYLDKRRYRYVLLTRGMVHVGQVGDYGGTRAGVKVKSPAPRATVGDWLRLELDFGDNGVVKVVIDGEDVVAAPAFPSAVAGGVGCAASYSTALFDDFTAWDGTVVPWQR